MTVPTSSQFKSLSTPSGKKAFEAYTAGWENGGKNIFISAPTLELLKDAYKHIVGKELIVEAVQHVWIVKAEDVKEAPISSDPRGAEIKCSIDGCGNHASFIIDKKEYCFAHRK